MIVLEVPSQYLLIDEAHYGLLATVLGKCQPVRPVDYSAANGVAPAEELHYQPQLKLYPDSLLKPVQVPVADDVQF